MAPTQLNHQNCLNQKGFRKKYSSPTHPYDDNNYFLYFLYFLYRQSRVVYFHSGHLGANLGQSCFTASQKWPILRIFCHKMKAEMTQYLSLHNQNLTWTCVFIMFKHFSINPWWWKKVKQKSDGSTYPIRDVSWIFLTHPSKNFV